MYTSQPYINQAVYKGANSIRWKQHLPISHTRLQCICPRLIDSCRDKTPGKLSPFLSQATDLSKCGWWIRRGPFLCRHPTTRQCHHHTDSQFSARSLSVCSITRVFFVLYEGRESPQIKDGRRKGAAASSNNKPISDEEAGRLLTLPVCSIHLLSFILVWMVSEHGRLAKPSHLPQ